MAGQDRPATPAVGATQPGTEVPVALPAAAAAHLGHLDHTRVLRDTFAAELVELVDVLVATPPAVGAATTAAGPHPI